MKRLFSGKRIWILIAAVAVLVVLVLVAVVSLSHLFGENTPPEQESETTEIPVSGPEVGVYYFEDMDLHEEYMITLGEGCQFFLAVKDTAMNGSYTLSGETLTLISGDRTLNATLRDSIITLTYQNAQMRFLKKQYFTVAFDSVGGSKTESVSVLNGKTVSVPADPTRDGYVFLGWYADAAYKTPFAFGSEVITADTTLYARWAEKVDGQPEYEISYDLGYDGEVIDSTRTIGGKLYLPAVPATRDGYTFVGWWVSSENKADRLTSRFVAGDSSAATIFTSDTTLFAVWQETDAAPAPQVSVGANALTWDAIADAQAYLVRITAPDGTVIVDNQRTTTTTYTVSYGLAGSYRMEVTAVDAGGSAISETTVRYFTNRALDRVSGITVADPAVLVYRGVAHAEKYLITVDCGNKNHQHMVFDNGSSLCFNFANCDMQKGGIVFTITATANGYASSTVTFIYERHLAPVEQMKVDKDLLTWSHVSGATSYEVKIGDASYAVTENEFSLDFLAEGEYSISVTPTARGYNAPAPTMLTYRKTTPALPEETRLVGTVFSWSAVEGAQSYEVRFNGQTFTLNADTTEYDLSGVESFVEGADYTLSLKVIGANGSAETDVLTVRYNAMPDTLTYAGSILCWNPVLGATSYDVQINDGSIVTVEGGYSYYVVDSLTKEGVNTLRVRFHSGVFVSEWTETSVTAYAVTLDSRGGSPVHTLYKAVGDRIDLPVVTKDGYEFAAWYNVPGGAASNGAMYTDTRFTESGEIVLYAYYTPKSYSVIYNNNGDTSESDTVLFGREYQLKVPVSDDINRLFGGWFSAPYGTGIAYTDPEGNSLAPWTSLEDNQTLYAFWVESVLRYDMVGNGYAVSAGDRIGLVSSVTIPAEVNGVPVTSIVGGAFADCTNLVELRIPDTVVNIAADTAFSGCTALKSVEVYSTDTGKASARYSSKDGVLFDSGDSAAPHAPRPVFMPVAKTGAYTVPAGVDMIPRRAFIGSKLSKIILPSSVKEIGTEAFADCSELTTVVFEDAGVTEGVVALTIGDRAFMNCTKLTAVTLPARLSAISLSRFNFKDGTLDTANVTDAFFKCKSLETILVAKGKNSAFLSEDGVLVASDGTLLYCPVAKSVDTYEFPSGVTRIAAGAFFGSTISGDLVIPGRITSVGDFAFSKCDSLRSVTFTEGLSDVTVGMYAFSDSGISNITFGEGSRVCTLGEGAFYGCDKIGYDSRYQPEMRNITIPATMTAIGDKAFSGCGEFILTIESGDKLLTLGNAVFENCELESLTLPKNVMAGVDFFNGLAVREINVDPANDNFMSIDGVLFTKKAGSDSVAPETLLIYPSIKSDEYYTIPDGVTAIAAGAFADNHTLLEVTVPASVTLIGDRAFAYSYLNTVNFVEGGTEALTVGAEAFRNSGIVRIAFPERAKTLGQYALANTSKLSELTLGGLVTIKAHALDSCGSYWSAISNVTIPASVKIIDEYAFSGANISELSVAEGSQLETIGAYAFYGSSFSSFHVPATVTSIGSGAFYNNHYLGSLTFAEGDADLVIGIPTVDEYGNVQSDPIIDRFSYVSEIHLPGRLTVIGNSAFSGCYGLETVTFGHYSDEDNFTESRLIKIGENAFRSSGVTEITIPASVHNTDEYGIAIGNCAFQFSELTDVTFVAGGSKETAPLTIGASAFDGCSGMTVITLPARLASFADADGNTTAPIANGRGAFPYSMTDIHVAGNGESEYVSKDGILYTADMTEIVFCPQQKTGAVVLPASVTRISSGAFLDCDKITSVTFEEGSVCREIGSQAFYRCKGLVSLVIPDSVTAIYTDAFFNCTALESLTLPASLEAFDSSIIRNCNALQNLYVSESSTHFISMDGVLFTADGKTMVYYLPTRSDTSYTVPEGTEIIGENAFSSNSYLTSVTIPASVTLIDTSAFNGCSALADVIFAKGDDKLLVIGKKAFSQTALETVQIPARVVSISDSAFSYINLKSVTFAADSQLTSLGDSVFMQTGLTSINLPTSLRIIGNNLFACCKQISSVTIPEGVVSMGDSTFYECSGLVTVNLPSTLKTIGIKTFENCTALKHVNFARNSRIQVLPNTTFKGCTALESIELPASLTEITGVEILGGVSSNNIGLFSTCTALKRVTFAEGSQCTKIGISAFEKSALEEFTVPSSVTTIESRAFAFTKITGISFPRTVTRIGDYLFQACTELMSVDLGAGVTEIPDGTFANCEKLTSFTVPAGVKTISPSAFFLCYALNEFHVDKANTSFVVCDNIIYTKDWSLVIFPLGKTTFEIPKDAKALPDGFFSTYPQIANVTVEEGNKFFDAVNGVLYTKDHTDILFFSDEVTSYEIPKELPSQMTKFEFLSILHEAAGLETITVAEGNELFHAKFGVLYDADWNLILFPKARTEFRIPVELTVIPNGAVFEKEAGEESEDEWDTENDYSIFQGTALKYVTFEEGRTQDLRLEDVLYSGTVFGECEYLEEVSLPEHTLNLSDYAFIRCYSLRVINLPSTLTEMGRKPFYDCTLLEAINVAPGNSAYLSVDGILFDIDMNLVWFPAAKESFTIPASFTYLPSLSAATGLKHVTYEKDADGNEVAGEPLTLDSAAFAGLENMETIELPSRVTGISASMFSGCPATLTFAPGFDMVKTDENGVVYTKNETGWSVLMIPSGLTHYTIPADVTYIPVKIFSGSALETLDYATYIGEGDAPALVFEEGIDEGWYDSFGVFNNCRSLVSVSLPARLVSVPKYAFMDCSNLASVTFEEGMAITRIGEYAFQNCGALEAIDLPKTLTEIGEYAFYSCSSLTTVEFPEGLETIGEDAFEYCSSLESVYIPTSVETVGSYAFYGTYGTIYVAFSEAEADARCGYSWSGYYANVVYDYTKD